MPEERLLPIAAEDNLPTVLGILEDHLFMVGLRWRNELPTIDGLEHQLGLLLGRVPQSAHTPLQREAVSDDLHSPISSRIPAGEGISGIRYPKEEQHDA